MKTSCILRPEREPVAILRKSFIDVCGGDRCAAMLLANFEYWHNIKLGQSEQEVNKARDNERYSPNLSLWVYKSADDLTADLLGEYGRNKVLTGVSHLIDLGYVVAKPDSKDRFNRGRYFLLKPDVVNSALSVRGLKLNPRPVEKGHLQFKKGTQSSLFLNPLIGRERLKENIREGECFGSDGIAPGDGVVPGSGCGRCGGAGYVMKSRSVRGVGQQYREVCGCVEKKQRW